MALSEERETEVEVNRPSQRKPSACRMLSGGRGGRGVGGQCRAVVTPAAALRKRLLSKLMKNMSAGHSAQKEAALKAAGVIKVKIFFPFILSGHINSSRPATARVLCNLFTSAESRRG